MLIRWQGPSWGGSNRPRGPVLPVAGPFDLDQGHPRAECSHVGHVSDGPRRRPDGRRTLPAVGRGRDRLCHLGFDPNRIPQSWVARFVALRYWDAANRAATEFRVVCLLPTAVVALAC